MSPTIATELSFPARESDPRRPVCKARYDLAGDVEEEEETVLNEMEK